MSWRAGLTLGVDSCYIRYAAHATRGWSLTASGSGFCALPRPVLLLRVFYDRDQALKLGSYPWRPGCRDRQIRGLRVAGFDPADIQSYYPRPGDPPFEIDAESSQGLWESISAVHHADDAVPPSAPSA